MEDTRKSFIDSGTAMWRKILFLSAPLIAFYIIAFIEIDPDKPAVANTLAVALWMAMW